jgi:hypothetical protein
MGDVTYSTISIFFHKIKEKRSGKELYHPYEWNLLLLQTISLERERESKAIDMDHFVRTSC